jgi:hypothetical protein
VLSLIGRSPPAEDQAPLSWDADDRRRSVPFVGRRTAARGTTSILPTASDTRFEQHARSPFGTSTRRARHHLADDFRARIVDHVVVQVFPARGETIHGVSNPVGASARRARTGPAKRPSCPRAIA